MRKVHLVIITAMLATSSLHSASKKTLVEDRTGAWCQFCPRGPIEMENLKKKYPNNFIGITQHNSDGMENDFSKILCDKDPGYPSFLVDRILREYKPGVPDLPGTLSTTSPVAVAITQSWNNATRTVSGTITVKIESAPPAGALNIGLMIIEDKVVGVGQRYDQKNFYDTDNEYPELKGKGNPIKGYEHYMVQRACPLDGVYGKSGIIPNPPVIGTTYSTPYTYTVPAKYDVLNVVLANLYLVAFTGINDSAILNAEQIKLDMNTPIHEGSNRLAQSSRNFTITSSGAALELNIAVAGKYTVTLYSLSSQKLAVLSDSYMSAGIHQLNDFSKNLQSGVYIANVKCADGSYMKKVSLSK